MLYNNFSFELLMLSNITSKYPVIVFIIFVLLSLTVVLIICIKLLVPTTVSLPASPPARNLPVFELKPNIVGESKIIPPPIAFLYQLIPKLGTDGGFKLNLPLILKCGIFSLGKDHEKLKKPLILLMALDTIFLAPFITLVILDLMPLKIDDTVDLTALNLDENIDLTLFNMLEIVFL